MTTIKDMTTGQRAALRIGAGAAALALTIGSAIFAKERGGAPAPLAAVETLALDGAPARSSTLSIRGPELAEHIEAPNLDAHRIVTDTELRWFNGRPVRPARTVMFKVTAYSPDARSCGASADGQTATLHSVETNGMRLVAADTRVLPFGSMLTVPGYAGDAVVPVLDRGGAIKGQRLDLLFATHEDALQWGVKVIPVTIWEYADGKPAEDPRKVRGS